MTELSKSQVAMSFYYLADNLIRYTNDKGSVSELFGEGQDAYLDELYPYAEAIEEAWENGCKDVAPPGVWHYEVADDLAPKLFIEMIQCNSGDIDPRPDLDSWKKNITKVVSLWANNKLKYDEPLIPQVNMRICRLTDISIAQKNATVEKLLEPLRLAGIGGIEIKENPRHNLTEIFIGDHLYASIKFKIYGHEATTTVDFQGMPYERN